MGGLPSLSLVELVVLFCGSALTLRGRGRLCRLLVPGGGIQGTSLMPAPDGSRQGYPRWSLYLHALAGMAFPVVVRVVADQQDTYGEAAAEFSVALRSMDTFGTDVITALQTMGRRSPQPQFREFSGEPRQRPPERAGTLVVPRATVSGLPRGRRIPAGERSRSARDAGRSLCHGAGRGAALLITILVVMGIAGDDTFGQLRLFVYLVLPWRTSGSWCI